MILLYETLYSSTDLLFIFGNNDNCSCINKLNKEYMECVEKIEDISLFDGINIDYNYLKELSFDEYIKQCFKGNYEQFEKYCDQKKQHVIFDISDAYKNEENYYSDVDIAETIKEAQKKYLEEEDNYYYESAGELLDEYIHEAFGGDEEAWEDYCEDIADHYGD